jgi:hypothetical protein
MPRPGPPDQSQQFLWLVIPEICPPSEGISWLGAGSLRKSSTALAKARPITDREQRSLLAPG